jgi:hypothetical protein
VYTKCCSPIWTQSNAIPQGNALVSRVLNSAKFLTLCKKIIKYIGNLHVTLELLKAGNVSVEENKSRACPHFTTLQTPRPCLAPGYTTGLALVRSDRTTGLVTSPRPLTLVYSAGPWLVTTGLSIKFDSMVVRPSYQFLHYDRNKRP